MTNQMFDLLKPRVLDILKSFQNDFLLHDKNALDNYSGDFILGVRPSGTDIFLLSYKEKELSEWKDFFSKKALKEKTAFEAYVSSIEYLALALPNRNTLYFFVEENCVTTIDRSQAIEKMLEYFSVALNPNDRT